jgi:hypothetical protein
LIVDLTNSGRPIEGTLEIRVWKGGPAKAIEPYSFYYRRNVFLSAQARKSEKFTVDPDSVSRPLTVSFVAPGIRVSKEIDLRRHFSPSPLLLLLAENNISPPIPLASISSSSLISLSIADLPSDMRAFRGISTIVVYEQSLRDLSKSQTIALEAWLSSGGRVLILGSVHYALYQEPAINRFLPVRVAGLRRFSSLFSLERAYGNKVPPLRDLLVQNSKLVEGKILLEEKGTPILVERSVARGKVFYLALDVGRPPVSRWQGLARLFADILGDPVERGSTLQASWDEAVFSQLLSNPLFIASYVPLRSFFLWLLTYLGGLGLLVWLWQRRWLPRRTIALSFFFLVFFSSCAGYVHFNRGSNIPDGVLVSSTLMESLPDGYAEAQSNVGLFSTQARYYDLQVENGWSDMEQVPSRLKGTEDSALAVQQEGGSTRFRFPLREWDYRLFKIRSQSHFPFHVEILRQDSKIVLKLTNRTTKDLTDCWLVISGQRFSLGDILKGSNQIREFTPAAEKDSHSTRMDLREINFSDKTRDTLFRYSFFPQDQGAGRWASSAFFFGWVKEAPRSVWVDEARIRNHAYALFRASIPLAEEEDS